MLSFPLAYFFYTSIGKLEFFPFLNFIGVFVVFALGADHVFVAVDKWKNARKDFPTLATADIAAKALPDAPSPSGGPGELQLDVNTAAEVARLDPDEIAAIRLVLFTKRLPQTEGDLILREDQTADLLARYSSGFSQISVAEYYQPFVSEAGFSQQMIDLVQFLVTNRLACKTHSRVRRT